VVFVGNGSAEQGHNAATYHLIDRARIAVHGVHQAIEAGSRICRASSGSQPVTAGKNGQGTGGAGGYGALSPFCAGIARIAIEFCISKRAIAGMPPHLYPLPYWGRGYK
jgi:hypothetical protein